MKKPAGMKGVENALLRLDMLPKEKNLMMMARNLEVTHHVDGNVKQHPAELTVRHIIWNVYTLV